MIDPVIQYTLATFSVLFGLILGSFFNVLIWRLPRGMSTILPGSACPNCGRPIPAHENIPVLSYLVLQGRCAGCKDPISAVYPAVEAITGVAALFLWQMLAVPRLTELITHPAQMTAVIVQIACLLALIPIAVIDIRHFVIPDFFTLPGLVIALLLSLLPGGVTPLSSVLGVAAGGGLLYLVGLLGELAFRKPDAMGGGDVKMMAWLGALFGWVPTLVCIVCASFSGALWGGVALLLRRLRVDHRIPFGPFLALGMWVAVLWGQQVVSWYFSAMDRLILGV